MKVADLQANPPDRQKKIRKEVLRKLVHLLEVPLLLVYSIVRYYFGEQVGILFLTAVLIILLEIEYIRLEYKLKLPEVIDILRNHERDNIAGNIFFTVANIICFAAFEYRIALTALLLTVFGDMMSALVGRWIGRIKIYRKKTLEGFLAGLLINGIVAALLLNGPSLIIVWVAMAITASIVELFTGKLDDNLTVPLASGFVGQSLIFLMGTQVIAFPGIELKWLLHLFS